MAKGDKYYHSPFMDKTHPFYNRTLELTEDEEKNLSSRLMGRQEYADSMKVWGERERANAHENIDTLINQDDNKDYYELMKKISNFIPPTGILNLLQLANRPQEESLAAYEAFRKPEEDPMTPPRAAGPPVPFSEYIQDRNQYMPWLDKGLGNKQDVISILQKYTDELTKKK